MNKITLYDTLSRNKRLLKPLNNDLVNIYVCGMTVYDYCHIGHARVLVFFDSLVRYLKDSGYSVNYVRNVTDVDDKIIKAAKANNEDPKDLTTRFIGAALQDEAALNVLPPNNMPLATEHIDDMLADIAVLIDKGYAYNTESGVYYKVAKLAEYGKLSGKKLDDLIAGARVEVNSDKQAPADFALWKLVDKSELGWDSPWGYGRPGWHIECSTMATKCLAPSIDIHGGGNDLIFPHHENEIAQAQAVTGQEYVSTWMHTGHVCLDDTKMSKSLGNFFTIREVLAHYPGEAIRLFLLSSHYRSPINYTQQRLIDAHKSLVRLYHTLVDIKSAPMAKLDMLPELLYPIDDFYKAMNDDLNTPVALAALFELATQINSVKESKPLQAGAGAHHLLKMASLFGVLQEQPEKFLRQGAGNLDIELIEDLIAQRIQARADTDWQLADQLRDKIIAQGVEISDKDGKTTWQRRVI
jgi:cysteinyl-tRNA synthetase